RDSLFYLSIHHAPRSTLFPYTTLFRSYYETRGMLDKAEDALFDWLDTSDPEAPNSGLAFYERLSAKNDQDLERGGLPRDEVEEGDRKSTRLNSSHGSISYAVFCLKKKN